jgi:hypothetical protein
MAIFWLQRQIDWKSVRTSIIKGEAVSLLEAMRTQWRSQEKKTQMGH